MEIIKCLEILGLKQGYSKEEIRKNYRRLARMYHPDLYTKASKKVQEEAEVKMKEINESYETLEKRGYPFSSFSSSSYFKVRYSNSSFNSRNDLIKRIGEVLKDIEEILKQDDSFEILKNYREKLDDLVIDVSHYRHSDITLQEYEEKFTTIFDQLLMDFKEEFFSLNYIDDSSAQDLSFDVSLSEFYEKLKPLVFKYGRKFLFFQRLDEIVLEYLNHPYYESLKTHVDSKISFLVTEAYNKKFKDVDYIFDAVKKLLSSLYKRYEGLNDRLNNILSGYASLYGADIIENIQNFSSSCEFIKHVKELLLILKKYFMENYNIISFSVCENDLEIKRKLQNENPSCFQLLISIQRKYIFEYERRIKENISVTKIAKLYNLFLQVITLIINYNLNLDDFLELEELNFVNVKDDEVMLNDLFYRCKGLMNPNNVASLKINPGNLV